MSDYNFDWLSSNIVLTQQGVLEIDRRCGDCERFAVELIANMIHTNSNVNEVYSRKVQTNADKPLS